MEEVLDLSMSPLRLVPMGSSSLWGLLLRFFGTSTSNTSKYIVIIVLWFLTLEYFDPYSSWVRVVIHL